MGFHNFHLVVLICHFTLMILFIPAVIEAAEWKAGAASVVVTPEEPVWMAG